MRGAIVVLCVVAAACGSATKRSQARPPATTTSTIPVVTTTSATVPPTTRATAPPTTHATAPTTTTSTVPLPPYPHGRFASTASLPALAAAQSIPQAQAALQVFLSQYGVRAAVTSVSTGAYASQIKLQTLAAADLADLKKFGAVFEDEWSKYPTDWIAYSGVRTIAIVKHLAVGGVPRAATYDVVDRAMFYDTGYGSVYDERTRTFSDLYEREGIHHEFNHLIMYEGYGPSVPTSAQWRSSNPPGFTYGNGGDKCYRPPYPCPTGNYHPITGFVSGYATSEVTEDRAETYAYLMTGPYYAQLETWVKTDPYLAKKVALTEAWMRKNSPEMTPAYFERINS